MPRPRSIADAGGCGPASRSWCWRRCCRHGGRPVGVRAGSCRRRSRSSPSSRTVVLVLAADGQSFYAYRRPASATRFTLRRDSLVAARACIARRTRRGRFAHAREREPGVLAQPAGVPAAHRAILAGRTCSVTGPLSVRDAGSAANRDQLHFTTEDTEDTEDCISVVLCALRVLRGRKLLFFLVLQG
jgi:hypothetical protein